MQITKFGHSCILLDDGQTKILFDPGSWSELPDLEVDAIIITHVHDDHFDLDLVNKLVLKNPNLKIFTNTEVGSELEKNNLTFQIIEQGQSVNLVGFEIEGMGNDHAVIHPDWPIAQNTSYLINKSILHPGDALFIPQVQVQTLLLPVAAPWSKISETLDYISAVKPQQIFPIHDGFLKTPSLFHRLAKGWVEKINTKFIEPELNHNYEI